MVTREQYLARCDQEVAKARDELNRVLDTYASNMEHVAECSNCDEVDNIATLVKVLVDDQMNSPAYLAILFAISVKTVHELRQRVQELELEALAK